LEKPKKKNDILRFIKLTILIAVVLISIYFILTGSDPFGIFVGDDLPVPAVTEPVSAFDDPGLPNQLPRVAFISSVELRSMTL
jgi:hypothetical protein